MPTQPRPSVLSAIFRMCTMRPIKLACDRTEQHSGPSDVQISAFERTIAQQLTGPRSSELLICLNFDGTVEIDRSDGEVDRAELTKPMLEAMAREGVRLWHNHPSRGSLSSADWRLVSKNPGIILIAAVNDSGTIFAGSAEDVQRLNPGFFDDAAGVAEVPLTAPKMNEEFSEDMSFLAFFGSHLANEEAKNQGVISYLVEFSDHDQALWTIARNTGRDAIAAQEVSAHFARIRANSTPKAELSELPTP